MLAGIIAIYLSGTMVDVEVLGTADNQAECLQKSAETLAHTQPQLGREYEIVIKCVPADGLDKMTKKDFEAAPIAAAGFGTGKSE